MKKLHLTPHAILLCTFLIYIVIYCAHALLIQQTVYGDGLYYVSWMQSILVDHTGLLNNKYAIGPSLLWSPFYYWTRTIVQGPPLSFPYQFIIGLSSVLYVITGLILLYRLICTWTKPIVASITTSLIALATHLLFYGAVDPVNSHGLSFFAATVFLTLLFQKQNFFAGVGLGLLGLIRPQDIIYGVFFVPILNKKNLFSLCLGFFLAFLPQMFIWFTISGNPFVSPYFVGGEHFSFLSPHIGDVLFSLQNGLFVYTPLFVISVLGYGRSWEKQQAYKWPSLLILLASIYIVASWSTWSQGASYSGRMFVSILPIIAIALSKLLTELSKKVLTPLFMLLIFLLPLAGINSLLIFYFLLTHG